MLKRALALILILSTQVIAHPGALDAMDCHENRKTGEQHCHTQTDGNYAGASTVIDGDTIEIHGQKFRLFGIDAPETKQLCNDASGKSYRCGQVAANALSKLISGQSIVCTKKGRDRYNRIVATCFVNGLDLGAHLVTKGLAVAYVQYSSAYVSAEAIARSGKIGLWAGEFKMPWIWRKAH